jgi:outer membrane lipoprotein carrier protein
MIHNIKKISLAVCFSSLAIALMAEESTLLMPSQTFAIQPIELMAENKKVSHTTTEYTQQLAASLAKINTLKVNFKQISKQANGHTKEQNGSITLLKPSRYEILIDAPWSQKIINNGIYQWDYDIDLEEIHKTRVLADQKGSIIDLLSVSAEELSDLYTVSLNSQTDNVLIYKLVPKVNDSFSEFVLIGIENDLPKSIVNRDPLGNDSIFEFSDAQLNPIIDREYFDFTAPAGVDVYE